MKNTYDVASAEARQGRRGLLDSGPHRLERPKWRKSSYSNGNGGNNCVEVQKTDDGWRHVRNSKMTQYVIAFTPSEWDAFIAGVKAGEFD